MYQNLAARYSEENRYLLSYKNFFILLIPFLMGQAPDGFKPLEITTSPKQGSDIYVSNGGADRCQVKECLCKVEPEIVKSTAKKENHQERRISVFFGENSSNVQSTFKADLKKFSESHTGSVLTLIGYTDGCGNIKHNSKLARSRVESVKAELRSAGMNASSIPLFKPEVTNTCDPDARRVDVIAHTRNLVTTMIDKIPADVYLIDASGSMWQSMRQWSDVVSASFKPNSRIYLSKTISCRDGQSIAAVTPSGGTEIWYSYWRVLDLMKEGETLAIISDFVSDIPLTRRESVTIENKVAKKRIKVIAIQL